MALLPAAPVSAFSLGDIFGKAGTRSAGGDFINILLGVMVTKLLGDKLDSPPPAGSAGEEQQLTGKEVMTFYAEWWAEDTSSYDALTRNSDVIRTIIPFWGTLQADGSLTDRGGSDHAAVVRYAHSHQTKVMLMVNNAKQTGGSIPVHDLLSSAASRQNAIDNLEAAIKRLGLDGVNIDFELVPAADRDNLTGFMRELYGRLQPQGYSVSIDVMPKTSEDSDVAAAYDYAGLAAYADRIVVMTYDQHGDWSGPGPIADPRWVEENIRYALRYIPRQKLYMGLAGYGYDWSSGGVESLEYGQAMARAGDNGAAVLWDDAAKAPHFTYQKAGTSHSVWFENRESTKDKLALVAKYDLAGAALWKLGEEDPACWPLIRDKLR